MEKKFLKTQKITTGPKINDFGSFKREMLKQKEAEMKAQVCQYASFNPADLVYLFEPIEAVQIQQILYALQNGYELKSITNSKGVVQFVLSYKGK